MSASDQEDSVNEQEEQNQYVKIYLIDQSTDNNAPQTPDVKINLIDQSIVNDDPQIPEVSSAGTQNLELTFAKPPSSLVWDMSNQQEYGVFGRAIFNPFKTDNFSFLPDKAHGFYDNWRYNFNIILGPDNIAFVDAKLSYLDIALGYHLEYNPNGVLWRVNAAGIPDFCDYTKYIEQNRVIESATKKTIEEHLESYPEQSNNTGWYNPLQVINIRGNSFENQVGNTFGLVRNGNTTPHQGVDLVARVGTPVSAVQNGTIIEINEDPGSTRGYGSYIILEFEQNGETLYAFYAHLSEIHVSPSQVVQGGQILGLTGTTGNATGMEGDEQHLHFEIATASSFPKGLDTRLDPLQSRFLNIKLDMEKGRVDYVANAEVQSSNNLSGASSESITNYDISLEEALDQQMRQSPQISEGYGWIDANRDQVKRYLDPSNYKDDVNKYQFLDISASAGVSVEDMKGFLMGKGILTGRESSFLNAAKKYNVSEVYLAAHAALETGNGSSRLANGIEVNGVIVYNMYGIGAYDDDPDGTGASYAYKMGWTTPEAAIEGGAQWISENYINDSSYRQNTLYKMRWNPASPGEHQYATDIRWAVNQVYSIKAMYDSFPNANLTFEIPVYRQ